MVADKFNVPCSSIDEASTQFDRMSAACSEIGRDPAEISRSAALTVAVARTAGELARRAGVIGQKVDDLRAGGVAGSPVEAADRLSIWRERTGISRIYLQLLDLTDLDQIGLIAAEVMPQLR